LEYILAQLTLFNKYEFINANLHNQKLYPYYGCNIIDCNLLYMYNMVVH